MPRDDNYLVNVVSAHLMTELGVDVLEIGIASPHADIGSIYFGHVLDKTFLQSL